MNAIAMFMSSMQTAQPAQGGVSDKDAGSGSSFNNVLAGMKETNVATVKEQSFGKNTDVSKLQGLQEVISAIESADIDLSEGIQLLQAISGNLDIENIDMSDLDSIEGLQLLQMLLQNLDLTNVDTADLKVLQEVIRTVKDTDLANVLNRVDGDKLLHLIEDIVTNEVNSEELTALQTELQSIINSLETVEFATNDVVNELSEESLATLLREYFLANDLDETNEVDETIPSIVVMPNVVEVNLNVIREIPGQLQEELQQIYQQAEKLLLAVQNGEQPTKVAPRLLSLLEQWQRLTTNQPQAQVVNLLQAESANKDLSKVWQELLQTFQKRASLTNGRQYTADANVSTKDIARWISSAVEAMQTDNTKPAVTNMQNSQGASVFTPISKVEQFVIHLNQTQTNTPVDKQLIEQFKKIMTANRIMHLQKTSGGLNMTLRPQNLGEMMVRFTQVNGETLVKIIVSSAQAKDMLERNMSQLRSMFAPHQVSVEKQDTVVQQSTESEKSQEKQQQDEETQQHDQQQNGEDAESSFSNIFEEVLLNEKV